jgi:hypothetical protein
MGDFFSRLSKLVDQVKDRAAETGMLVAPSSGDGTSVSADAAAASHPSTGKVIRQPGTRVGRAAKFDPYRFPSAGAVGSLLGVVVKDQFAHTDEEWLGTISSFDGGHAEVRFCAAPPGEPFDAAGCWEYLTVEVTERTAIEVGEAAFVSGELTFVLAKGSVFRAAVYYDGSGGNVRAGTSLAELAVREL